jgi:hypothetical protein
VEVLNKSAIILLVACWEAYVEDLAATAFDIIAAAATSADVFPSSVLVLASKELRSDPDETKVWQLAGEGWKRVLQGHRTALFDRFIGKLNTPKPALVDDLFLRLLGLQKLSASWRWHGTTSANAAARLISLVALRGEIAHRVTVGRSVRKQDVIDATNLVGRLSAASSNRVSQFLIERTGSAPWKQIEYTEPW